MRIDFLEYAAMDLPRREPFTIARGSSTVAQNVMVVVHSGSLSGNGSGAPTDVTGETVRSAMGAIKSMARALEGFTFERPREVADKMDKVLPGNPSAKAAIDIAVHDLAAQHAGVPLHRYLGATRDRMVTDMTIGIMDTRSAVERAQRWTQAGVCRTIDVNTICESAGSPTMVGCMGEPQISIAAALAFALGQKNVRWLDLDSHFNLAEDPSTGLRFENGELIAPDRPGLGI